MKYAIIIAIFYMASVCRVSGQGNARQAALLQSYYDIKNALVDGDAHTVMQKLGTFSAEAVALDTDKSNPANAILNKLRTDAGKMAGANDLAAQRLYFASLSSDLYTLLKAAPFSKEPVYRLYCPMKKAYWLSNVKTISNPYYGRAMLTCGIVNETINPIK
jgi:hypothetical protein